MSIFELTRGKGLVNVDKLFNSGHFMNTLLWKRWLLNIQ